MIAETARLRRAAARAGNGVPAGRQLPARPPGARIDVDDGAAFELRKIDRAPVGRGQRQIRHAHARQVTRGAVVPRRRQIGGQQCRIVQDRHVYSFCRIRRPRSRCQSRFFSVSRLSCSFLPRASAISTLARPRLLK